MTKSALCAALSFSLLILFGCDTDAPTSTSQSSAPIAVNVMSVDLSKQLPTTEFVGRTRAPEDVKIRPLVSGRLINKAVAEGADVQKGQLLYELDPKPFQVRVNAAKAQLARSTAEKAQAKRTLTRAKKLHTEGSLSPLEYEEIQLEFTTSTAAFDIALSEFEKAQLDLDWTKIYSPIEGRVSNSHYSIGDIVTPNGDPLTTVVKLDTTWVNISVNETTELAEFQEAMLLNQAHARDFEVHLKLSNGAEYPYLGQVGFVDNRVDVETGTIPVRLNFPNPERLLLPGQYVTVEVVDDSLKPLSVPSKAVQFDQGGHFVYSVSKSQRIEKNYIQWYQQLDGVFLVESGVSLGDFIVVDGLQKVRPGVTVAATVLSKGE
ncbi:efflux RND transporter periplasmic adaptor subunit [Vibrio sp. ZSDZ34]|uniref:Efflux RND transporter periplasmic adaptor subunit n=1 Tax=Vibrio gelatinilyticus TaxID=2893468 RepID=A0A9X1WEI9_9VIBR|nr:efflux RND transporter periplasmic adaptor subunit [Vibrio gelatinilyticus]MCJ2376860.1 efflux RND transporter periplasmic adaptor subunit [Vibrio gelatinilyticus]